MEKFHQLKVVSTGAGNVVGIRDKEKKLQARVDALQHENKVLRAALARSRQAAGTSVELTAEAQGEYASLVFMAGEVVTNYRCARNAEAGGHTELAAKYKHQLDSWIAQMGANIDRPDTLYVRFKTVLTP